MIPDTLTSLCSLRIFELTYNDVQGDVTEFIERVQSDGWAHHSRALLKLTELQELHLSGNSFTMELNSDWIPPRRLLTLGLRSCYLGPEISSVAQITEENLLLCMSNASIADTMPDWFWTAFRKG
ncbi:hypothetical protein ZWY2020_045628 [Hordeum vulgare]|nr:hypothetical protein ZWY2020_045628 [Hordeum vulgare]